MQGGKVCIELGVLVEGDVVLGLWAGDHKGVRASSKLFALPCLLIPTDMLLRSCGAVL